MKHHNMTPDEVLKALNTDASTGLSKEEVEKRREQYGYNRLNEKKKKTMLQRFFE